MSKNDLLMSMPPIVDDRSRVIILGSMPGNESLMKGQYYARSQNQFWRIIYSLFDLDIEQRYDARVAFVKQKGIALWDALEECRRPGSSLDSWITEERSNDFEKFFDGHPHIHNVFFNGKKAYESFFELATIRPSQRSKLTFKLLPSTSPANARMTFNEKLAAWRAVKEALDLSLDHV